MREAATLRLISACAWRYRKPATATCPLDNIERAIKKGSGELEGASLAEVILEGYGPSGTAILVNALTDNRNRTIQDVRNTFQRHGGSLGESGCVSWIFDSKGVITIKTDGLDADELALSAIDAGAEDVKVENRLRGGLYQAGAT